MSVRISKSPQGSVVIVNESGSIRTSDLMPHDEAVALAASVLYHAAVSARIRRRTCVSQR